MKSVREAASHYARQLNEATWTSVLGYAYLLFFGIGTLRLLMPAQLSEPLRLLGLAIPPLLLIAKDLAQFPDVVVRLRRLRAEGARWPRFMAACLPPALLGMARLDRALWSGFFRWLRRQPNPARPAGNALTYHQRGAYSTAVAFGLFSTLIELPLSAAILPLLIRDPDAVGTIHLVMAAASIYTLVWLLGDRWMVRDDYHVLTDTHLDLHIGARASARIPLDAIADAQPLSQSLVQWRRANPCRPADMVSITPFDKPNLVLRLRPGVDCAITHHGVAREEVRYVFLYLDRPQQLTSALAGASLGSRGA
ncbi:hypothetical protein [Massilia sp. Mn16-1_5]|uniref:hypothetical protein n=1 Tax=Massilia sp. Mn16-1_5 TaxID=2079199 RepID=UPI00109EB88A|nr:hypothetical protein [Massilia sp. Mn16-1_5]THC44133.1 hypothetical protein C2862_09590 [Massilia sp. Mn16-1_5]